MMYSVYNNLAPSYLRHFQKVSDTHLHDTRRSSISYVIPHVKSQGSNSFMLNGAKLWNIPTNIKSTVFKDSFKLKCKKYLFQLMSEKESDDSTI